VGGFLQAGKAVARVAQVQTSQTPILDRLIPLPAPPKLQGLVKNVRAFFQAICIYVLAFLILVWPPLGPTLHAMLDSFQAIFSGDWVGVRLILTGFAILFVGVIAIAVHECGHLLIGLAVGFRFRFLHVLRFQIDRDLRFSRQKASDDQSLGGTLFFIDEMRKQPTKFACMILAGPLANLLTGCVLMILPFHKSLVSGSFVLISFFLGLQNLLPFRTARHIFDGRRLFTLLWNRARHERRLALARIAEDLRAGIASESLSADLIASAITTRDKSLETVLAHSFAYSAAYNLHKDNEAAELLETCLKYSSYAPSLLKEANIANAGIFQAERRKRIDLAEQWLAELPSNPEVPYARFMVEGAILETQGDFSGALGKVDEIEKAILSTTEAGQQQSALRPFAKWKAELQQKIASQAVEKV
jgi:hypothetical protein